MESNLHTTIKAYPKVSPSILSNYPTKEDLEESLNEYVKEAPNDSFAYSRKNQEWVAVDSDMVVEEKKVYFGVSQETRLCSECDIKHLGQCDKIDKGERNYSLIYEQKEIGYLWIVSTAPIKVIYWALGLVADYIKQEVNVNGNGVTYYCYRITDKLVPGTQSFTLQF